MTVVINGTTGITNPNSMTIGNGGGSVATNTAVGASALAANTSGSAVTGVGYQAGSTNTTGVQNTFLGAYAGGLNTTGSANIAIGYGAYGQVSSATGDYNTVVGNQALNANTTASLNTVVGYRAGYTNSTGARTVSIGSYAGYTNSTSSDSVCIGYAAGYSSTGSSNTFIGARTAAASASGELMTTGSKNTIIGAYDGNSKGLDIRTADNRIVLSDGDGNPQVYVDQNAKMTIGCSGFNGGIRMPSTGGIIYIASVTSNSQLQISYNSTSAGVALGSGATSWSTFSDMRLKTVTGTYENALADIAQIEPIKFTWKNDPDNKPCVGVSAQSVQNVVPEAMDSTTYEMGGDTEYLQVRYTELIPLMIASIKELKADLDATKAELAALKGQA